MISWPGTIEKLVNYGDEARRTAPDSFETQRGLEGKGIYCVTGERKMAGEKDRSE